MPQRGNGSVLRFIRRKPRSEAVFNVQSGDYRVTDKRKDVKQHKCLVMFSGGLDSVVAAHLLKRQGLEVEAVHFVLPFESGLGKLHAEVRERAETLGVPLIVVEEGEEFLQMLKDPSFGYGKHVNPCIDCRIHRLEKAAAIMRERGASFIATGEVVGQRPMSQRMDAMRSIEKRAGLEGLLLRPLCAKLLEPTVPEREGVVDREQLLDLNGRNRKPQLAYAKEHNLKHGSPGGGCILTDEQTARRLEDLQSHKPDYGIDDLRLIAYGRRFRLSANAVVAVGRNADENAVLQQLTLPDDWLLSLERFPGPLGLARGELSEPDLALAASIIARYSTKARRAPEVRVSASRGEECTDLTVTPASELRCVELRV
ncbi:MAG: tRNA 4-thiouridine(8) synthase ThiI [Chitinivibrionales bacterium]|nr:tRNA 4-thiouridine(8) synthase ThiI [Chitinivibrionales bacterium]